MRRHALVAVAAAVALATAAPASAHATCGYSQTCIASGYRHPGVGSGRDITASCTVVTTFPTQATVIQCYLWGSTGDVHWTDAVLTQGAVGSMSHTFDGSILTSPTYQVCMGAGYFGEGGQYHPPANFDCHPVVET